MARFAEVVPGARAFLVDLNGGIAARIDAGGENDTAVSFVIEDDRITQIYAIRNAHKLKVTGADNTTARCVIVCSFQACVP